MPQRSAGILLFRVTAAEHEVLLVHPGGPFWANREAGAWSIPKGEYTAQGDPRACAVREFCEELGVPLPCPEEELVDLGEVRQRGGKIVRAWAGPGELDTEGIESNTFTLEWPPRSGQEQEFSEVDRAEWMVPERAREMILPAQADFLDRLGQHLAAS